MTRDRRSLVALRQWWASRPPTLPSTLAKWAYRLACLGPLSLFVIALMYPSTDPRALPDLSVQILWWLLMAASPVGYGLGAVAYFLIRRSPVRVGGRNYAVAAMIVGFLVSASLPFGTNMLNDERKANRHRHWGSLSCESNVKQLSLGMMMYAQDYDEHYPPSATWNATTAPYIKNAEVYCCPYEEVQSVPSYGMNRQLSGVKTDKVADTLRTVLLFDSVPGENQSGGPGLLPTPDRHNGTQSIGFADGHVKSVPAEEIGTLLWTLPADAQTKTKQAGHAPH